MGFDRAATSRPPSVPEKPAGASDALVQRLVEHRLALLIDAVEEYAIFMLDPDGLVMTWNGGARRIKGYEPEEIVGQPFSVFYTEDDISAGKPERELAEAVDTGRCRDEGWRVRKDGTQFWANVTISPLYDAEGQLLGFAKITRDDSDRRQTEEQVRLLELLGERERIAGQLHNSIVHQIFDASLTIQGAMRLVTDPIATARIQAAIDSLDATLREIRTTVIHLGTEG